MARSIFEYTVRIFLVIFGVSFASNLSAQSLPDFNDYPVVIFSGQIKLPKWIHRAKSDPHEWRDDLDKLMEEPGVNFAGHYYLATHSCGTQCGYYTLTDLSNARENQRIVDQFAFAEPPPMTRDGYPYWTDLFFRPNSKLLIAQFKLDKSDPSDKECRERSFIFEDGALKPITGTRRTCRKIEAYCAPGKDCL
jgi:hypothetical protein